MAIRTDHGTITFGPPREYGCDLNADGACDLFDIDSLVDQPSITQEQIDEWLTSAGEANGFAAPLLRGDANLDGAVDPLDLNQVGRNWLAIDTTWSSGDFNGDGWIDFYVTNDGTPRASGSA